MVLDAGVVLGLCARVICLERVLGLGNRRIRRGRRFFMSDVFERAFREVLELEGVFSNHASDRGGKTKYGITEGTWEGYVKAKQVANPCRIEDLSVAQAKAVYRWGYWDHLGLDSMPPLVAMELFDAGVNCGPGAAVRFLQWGYNAVRRREDVALEVDGKLGPKTLKAVWGLANLGHEKALVTAMNIYQGNHYIRLAEQFPSQRDFMRGWMKRCMVRF